MSSFGVFFRSCTKRKCDKLFILYFSQYIFLSKKSVKCLFKNSIKSQNIHKKIFLLLTFSQRFGSLWLFLCVCEFINTKIKKGKCSSESKKAKIFTQLFLFCSFWDDFWVLRRKKHSFVQNSKENGFTFFSHLSNISLFKFHGHFFGIINQWNGQFEALETGNVDVGVGIPRDGRARRTACPDKHSHS